MASVRGKKAYEIFWFFGGGKQQKLRSIIRSSDSSHSLGLCLLNLSIRENQKVEFGTKKRKVSRAAVKLFPDKSRLKFVQKGKKNKIIEGCVRFAPPEQSLVFTSVRISRQSENISSPACFPWLTLCFQVLTADGDATIIMSACDMGITFPLAALSSAWCVKWNHSISRLRGCEWNTAAGNLWFQHFVAT